jgi:type I restriction enzyme, S subunit
MIWGVWAISDNNSSEVLSDIVSLPSDWKVVKLQEITTRVCVGFVGPCMDDYCTKEKGIPFIRTTNLTDEGIDYSDLKYVSKQFHCRNKKSQLIRGDIIVARFGDCGKACYYDSSLESNCLNVVVIRPDETKCESKFLLYSFKNPLIKRQIEAGLVGSVQKQLNTKTIAKLEIFLPKIEEQQRISSFIDSLSERISLNKKINSTLEEFGQVLFKRWFVDFEFLNHEGNPYKSTGGKMVDSELGEIPENWEARNVGDVLELAYGKPLKETGRQNGVIPVYGSNGRIGWHNERLVKGPGIIVGRKGNPGTILWSETDFFSIDTTFYVVPKGIVKSLYYLFYALQRQGLPSLSADSAVPGLNRNIAYMNHILVPSEIIMEQFDGVTQTIFQKIENNNQQSTILSNIRDLLLPKLMSGKITVPINKETGRQLNA